MKKRLFLLGIGLAVAMGSAAQTSSQNQTPPVSSTTPATQVGSGAQTKAGTPAQSSAEPPATNSPVQQNPANTAEPPAQASTPAVPGAAQNPSPETSNAGIAAVNDTELEGQIQNALNKEPTLTGDSTHVTVSAEAIELAGNVNTSKEKITATRIVQSYAGSKKVMNHLTISGKGEPRNPQQQTGSDSNHAPGSTNPANQESIKNNGQSPAQPPLR